MELASVAVASYTSRFIFNAFFPYKVCINIKFKIKACDVFVHDMKSPRCHPFFFFLGAKLIFKVAR